MCGGGASLTKAQPLAANLEVGLPLRHIRPPQWEEPNCGRSEDHTT